MTPERLKHACEVAGGECTETSVKFRLADGSSWVAAYTHPALPAYVASILAEKAFTEYTVTEMDEKRVPYKWDCDALSRELEKHRGTGNTKEEAICLAWLAVNEHEETENATNN